MTQIRTCSACTWLTSGASSSRIPPGLGTSSPISGSGTGISRPSESIDDDRYRRDDGVRAVQQAGLDRERRLVVQPLAAELRDELGNDHSDQFVPGITVEFVDVVENRPGQVAVGGADRVELDRQV